MAELEHDPQPPGKPVPGNPAATLIPDEPEVMQSHDCLIQHFESQLHYFHCGS
jgi:hypothetical protein